MSISSNESDDESQSSDNGSYAPKIVDIDEYARRIIWLSKKFSNYPLVFENSDYSYKIMEDLKRAKIMCTYYEPDEYAQTCYIYTNTLTNPYSNSEVIKFKYIHYHYKSLNNNFYASSLDNESIFDMITDNDKYTYYASGLRSILSKNNNPAELLKEILINVFNVNEPFSVTLKKDYITNLPVKKYVEENTNFDVEIKTTNVITKSNTIRII